MGPTQVSITVRAATDADRADVARHADSCTLECRTYRGDLPQPGARSLVALVDGHTVGSISWDDADSVVTVGHLFVDTDARSVGVGAALLTALMDDSRRAGRRHLSCAVQPGNRNMKNLLERLGIIAMAIRAGVDLV